MAQASYIRSGGRTPITKLGERLRGNRVSVTGTGASSPRVPVLYEFVAANWAADSTLHYVTVSHGLGTMAVIFNCYDQDGLEIWPEKAVRTTTTLKVWLDADYTPTRFYVVVL